MKKYLIIGNGVAGTTAAQEIRSNDPDGDITMVTSEAISFYSRIKLPDFVAGLTDSGKLIVKKDQWYKDQRITLLTGTTIVDIDHGKKTATDDQGRVYPYDSLLIASGSYSFIPPVNGSEKQNVFALRTHQDAVDLAAASDRAGSAVVIGGGLLGLEAAHALIKKGLTVVVVEFFDRLLPRQMDTAGAALLKKMLEDMGFAFRLDAKTKAVKGDQAVTGVELESGEIIAADLVLFSTGVRSELTLPEKLALETDRGVRVDERMETSLPGVYAAGDVAQFEDTNFCIWPEAQEQGRIAGINMAGKQAVFAPIVPSNRLKVAGIDLASAGNIDPDDELEADLDKSDVHYRKIVKKDGRIIGCIMLGDTSGFNEVVKQISG